MDVLLAMLLHWLGRNTSYDLSDVPVPEVVQMSAEQLTRELYADNPELMPASGIDRRVFALYNWERSRSGVIYLLRAEDTQGLQPGEDPLENPVFQERLLHELVHHIQFHTGAYDRFVCRKEGEKEAYQLGGLYLKQRHANDPLPNRNLLAHIYSRC